MDVRFEVVLEEVVLLWVRWRGRIGGLGGKGRVWMMEGSARGVRLSAVGACSNMLLGRAVAWRASEASVMRVIMACMIGCVFCVGLDVVRFGELVWRGRLGGYMLAV